MHFRNIGRPRSLEHEVSVVKAAAYDFTQLARTKKKNGRRLKYDSSIARAPITDSETAGHKHVEPTIHCGNGPWLIF